MLGEPVHHTILAIDVEGFTRRPRRDVDRLRMRGELYRSSSRRWPVRACGARTSGLKTEATVSWCC